MGEAGRGKLARTRERRRESYEAARARAILELDMLNSLRAFGRVLIEFRDGELYQIDTTLSNQPGMKPFPSVEARLTE